MIIFRGIEMISDFVSKKSEKFRNAQNTIDTETIKLMENYVPIAGPKYRNRGKMSRSHIVQKPGEIINTEPKARREYYTNKGFSGPGRGKFWLERMKSDHKREILSKAREKFR
ncbi:MAG: minor capsid protein [archaeon]|nr:minor capsid protein [archaeon]